MQTTQTLKQNMRKPLAVLTLGQLVEVFELTDSHNSPEIPEVRGAVMDELEARNLQAFEAWIDSATNSPRSFFLTV